MKKLKLMVMSYGIYTEYGKVVGLPMKFTQNVGKAPMKLSSVETILFESELNGDAIRFYN